MLGGRDTPPDRPPLPVVAKHVSWDPLSLSPTSPSRTSAAPSSAFSHVEQFGALVSLALTNFLVLPANCRATQCRESYPQQSKLQWCNIPEGRASRCDQSAHSPDGNRDLSTTRRGRCPLVDTDLANPVGAGFLSPNWNPKDMITLHSISKASFHSAHEHPHGAPTHSHGALDG